jgi:hypothetical protein
MGSRALVRSGRRRRLTTRVSLVFVPIASLMAFGGLAVTSTPAGASTTSAASTGVPNLGPELAALEAQVSATLNDVSLPCSNPSLVSPSTSRGSSPVKSSVGAPAEGLRWW